MTKFCFVCTVPLTIKAFMKETAIYLHQQGHFDITLVCDEDPAFGESLPSFIHYHPIPMKRGISLGGILAERRMEAFFKAEQFDIIQYATPNASFYASMAARQAGIPVRIYSQWGIAYSGFTGLKRAVFKELEKETCRNSTVIQPDSKGNLKFSIQEGLYPSNKGYVIGDGSAAGVDLVKFDSQQKPMWRTQTREKLGYNPEDCVIGFVGRLNRDKGINELLEAFFSLAPKHVRLLCVGSLESKESLDPPLYKKSLQDPRIIYTGNTPNVEEFLSAMDIFVLPSYREGFGSVVIEASAMELPVIVTNIPGPTEGVIPEETGLVIEKQNVSQLKTAIETLVQDKEKRKHLGQKGLAFVQEHFEQKRVFQLILEDRLRLIAGTKLDSLD